MLDTQKLLSIHSAALSKNTYYATTYKNYALPTRKLNRHIILDMAGFFCENITYHGIRTNPIHGNLLRVHDSVADNVFDISPINIRWSDLYRNLLKKT